MMNKRLGAWRGLRASSAFFSTQTSTKRLAARLALTASVVAVAAGLGVQPARAIIVRDNVGIANSVDTANQYPAVVQLFVLDNVNAYGGGVGAIYYNCTGTLINPRTILTAAHCVKQPPNDLSSENYGQPFNGQALTFLVGSGVDTLPRLINFATTGADYNQGGTPWSTDVIVHPSAEASAGGMPFPWADTALIALSDPVSDVNPMGVLLSPLSSLTHVVQIGYGTYGVGSIGQQGISTKRLMGENMLGILGSDSNFIDALFPAYAPSAVNLGFETQVEYYTDFDNPNRPAANAGCTFTGSDINCVNDQAVQNIDFFPGNALPREVTTAPGDSGGPLIADQIYSKPLVIGNLSGGWSFFATPSDQYGGNGTSFYQPLFSEFQFIVQNNPYKYVGAKAGNGAWEDPNHWVQLLDPNYYVIDANGNVVNGIPSGTEQGIYQTTPQIGTVLSTDVSTLSTANSPYIPQPSGALGGTAPAASATLAMQMNNDVAHALVTDAYGNQVTVSQLAIETFKTGINPFRLGKSNADSVLGTPANPLPQTTYLLDFGGNLPTATALLGPGSTGFVPNNTDGVVSVAYKDPATYFDVTLGQNGTTTLSTFYMTVDRLTVQGNAALDIKPAGGLLTNIDIELYDNGHLNVDGIVGAPDIIADGGVISGNGTFVLGAGLVPSLTQAIAIGNGAITPGPVGGVGTMTVLGNVGITQGGLLLVDADGTSFDLLNVAGVIAMNGTVQFNPVTKPYWHQAGTFAEAAQIVTIGMSVPDTIPGVLYPVVSLHHLSSYDTLALQVEAASFATQYTARDDNETAIGNILDGDRNNSYGTLQAIYGNVDTLEGTPLANAFDQLAPNAQFGFVSAGRTGLNLIGATLMQRLSDLRFASGEGGTGLSFNGLDDVTLAMTQNLTMTSPLLVADDLGAAASVPVTSSGLGSAAGPSRAPVSVESAQAFGAHWGGFLTGSVLNGSADYGAGQHKAINGYLVMGGVDALVDTRTVLGAAVSMTDADADLPYATGKSTVKTYQGSLYGTWSDEAQDFFVSGFAGYGGVDATALRYATLGGVTYAAHSSPGGSQAVVNVMAGTVIAARDWLKVYPQGGLEYDNFHTDAYTETGSIVAMHVGAATAEQLLVRVGGEAAADWKLGQTGTVHPSLRAFWVGALADTQPPRFTAAFAAAPTGGAQFAALNDTNWLEFGVGVNAALGQGVSFSLSYDATVSRKDANYGAVTGHLRILF